MRALVYRNSGLTLEHDYPLVSACYQLNEGLEALEYARQKGVLKVLMRI